MLRRTALFILTLLTLTLFGIAALAQDGFNLPADLYVLVNDGQIRRYGVGAAGVTDLTPPNLYIIDFGVDVLGERIAFRTEAGLYMINVAGGGDIQQLEGVSADVPPYRGMGATIAWSPTGDAIAYTALYGARVYFEAGGFADLREGIFRGLSWSPGGRFLAADAEGDIWWIYRREGNSLVLTSIIPASTGTAWVSDGEIVFTPVEGGLRLMNLDQANAQAVLLDDTNAYRLPTLDASDALVFFGMEASDGSGRLLRLARGAQQLQTIGEVPIAVSGLRWAPGGSVLVAFNGGVIALYDPSTGLGFPLPIENVVAYTWGSPRAIQPPASEPVITDAPLEPTAEPPTESAPAPTEPQAPDLMPVAPTQVPASAVTSINLSADSFFLAPEPSREVVQVWRMRAGGQPPQPFTRSGTDVNEYAVSPDGERVAYVVEAELWLQDGVQQPQLLARINSFAPVEADFSADSTTLAYVDERSGVWISVLADDAPQLARANTNETYRRPQFSPDGTRLLLDVYSDDGLAIGVLDLTTRELVTTEPVAADDPRPARARWLRDGRLYTYVDSSATASAAPGIYILGSGLDGSPPEWVALPDNATVRSTVEAVQGTLRTLIADGAGTFAPLRVVDFDLATGANTPVLEIGSLIAPRLSPDGRFVGGYESLTEIDGIRQGAITVIDLQSGQRYVLSNPTAAWNFEWAMP